MLMVFIVIFQNNSTLLDDENLTVDEAGVEDNQQILIEGEHCFILGCKLVGFTLIYSRSRTNSDPMRDSPTSEIIERNA